MTATAEKSYQEEVLRDSGAKAQEPAWLSTVRRRGQETFKETGFPTRKMEAWKYMSLEPVLKMRAARFEGGTCKKPVFDQETSFSFVNGNFCEQFLQVTPAHKALQWGYATRAEWAKDLAAELIGEDKNPFVAINDFRFEDVFVLNVPKETDLKGPVHLIFSAQGTGESLGQWDPRVLIRLERGAKAEIVLDFKDETQSAYFMNTVLNVELGENSSLHLSQVQRCGAAAVQFLTARVRQASGSSLEWVAFTQGGQAVRNEAEVRLQGENASCSLWGLAMLNGQSQVFHHAFVYHEKPNCISRQMFKNILDGKSVSEFDSLVKVFRGADGSDSGQLDRNLLLSSDARVYSRPQLEIDADDVKANHGAATGKLEKDELFYLRSRGLSKETARFLITYGFAEEVLQEIHHDRLRAELEFFAGDQIRKMIGAKK